MHSSKTKKCTRGQSEARLEECQANRILALRHVVADGEPPPTAARSGARTGAAEVVIGAAEIVGEGEAVRVIGTEALGQIALELGQLAGKRQKHLRHRRNR